MIINENFRNLIPALSADEYAQLEQNILQDGIREPLVLWGETLIDGHNRYEIATKHNLNYETVQKQFTREDDAQEWIIRNQFGRRNISIYDRARLALKLKPIIAERAKENQARTVENRVCQKSDEQKIDTKRELAKTAGVSHDTIAKVEKIERQAKPETKVKLSIGDISINEAYKQIVYKEREDKRESERVNNSLKVNKAESPEELNGLFQTIVIDPPWDWGDESDVNQFGRAKPDYATISIEKLLQLPVGKLSDTNCHLYLWVTNRSLPKAFSLIEKWGFRYITCITWVKPSFGMGNYFRGSTEQLLFAVKGSQPIKRKDIGTHFVAPRGDRHSSKPNEAYELIESCSYMPYLEMFSRTKRVGWKCWGEASE